MPSEKMAARLQAGREYRKFDVSHLEVRSGDGEDGEMIVEGYATIFNQPYELYHEAGYTVMEQVDARAFDEADMSDVIMQYDHEGRVFARMSNGTLDVKPDNIGLYVRANLAGTQLGRGLHEDIKGGYITRMSFGFTVDEDTRTVQEDHSTGAVTITRTITKIRKLYDVSAVSIPANDATEISARGLSDGLIAKLAEESRKLAMEKLNLRLKLMEEEK